MIDVPIRRLTVSDFRRIEGTREIPLDAPVVLIHGPNGTGKTSILSALELALTGEIQSMERHSDRYRAHLPFLGQPYATVRADVADHLQGAMPGTPLTVNGARLEGAPAFNPASAQFYSERCYLDQSSLGRLLDLYQDRDGTEQSALEKFVNELLGLERLDALRNGLSDANDYRLLKKLAAGVDEADREAKAAAVALREQTAIRAQAREEVADARRATLDALGGLDLDAVGESDLALVAHVRRLLEGDTTRDSAATTEELHQELLVLRGRVSALAEHPTTQRIEETRNALAAASAEREVWETTFGSRVHAWEAKAEATGVNLGADLSTAVERATAMTRRELEAAEDVRSRAESVAAQLDTGRTDLEELRARLADAHEHSSALVEGLSALRNVVDGTNICPVCDRDFTEISEVPLREHADSKLAELTSHGEQLVVLRNERDKLAASVSRLEGEHARLTAQILSTEQQLAIEQRHSALVELASEVEGIEAVKSDGARLSQRVRDVQQSLADLEAASAEELHIRSELSRYAALLGVTLEPAFGAFQSVSAQLLEIAKVQASRFAHELSQYQRATAEVARLADALEDESLAIQRLAEVAENKELWDDRVTEAKRRQAVAREVHEAATQARTNIVHRVFTESLNEVWKTVFTRLAPNEGFIPSFGIPSATKKTFDIKLETTHRSGEAGGPPQMMLSAGNLNTAALSLFLALHLAVQPIVPCLVFDDPVQAMDELHVAQFAALIRLLSKQNDRQVIIAVHERELFDYLSLELSPAYEGDELITIELGERAADDDQGVTRHRWAPDIAIAD